MICIYDGMKALDIVCGTGETDSCRAMMQLYHTPLKKRHQYMKISSFVTN